MTRSWNNGANRDGMASGDAAARIERLVNALVRLANDDECCRLLNAGSAIAEEVDLRFLDAPLAWIGAQIAAGLTAEEQEGEEVEEDFDDEGVSLAVVVGLLRLYRTIRGGSLDEGEIRDAVIEALNEEDAEDGDGEG